MKKAKAMKAKAAAIKPAMKTKVPIKKATSSMKSASKPVMKAKPKVKGKPVITK